jgi:hypothetical protein
MEFQKTLLITVLLLFSVFLYPDIITAINLISISEPLRPILINVPIVYLLSLVFVLAYLAMKRE